MSATLQAINHFSQHTPKSIAIEGEHIHLSYQALQAEIESLASRLKLAEFQCLGLLMDNSPAWVIFDLAAQKAGITLVPIPPFFSQQQIQHSLTDAGVEALITNNTALASGLLPDLRFRPMAKVAAQSCWLAALATIAPKKKLTGIAKITYTSGTTGQAKGVCLSQESMDKVACSLSEAIQITANDRHISLLPLAVLLENVGGVYTTLLAGACCILPSLSQVGMSGATNLNIEKMRTSIINSRASTLILLPQMLQLWVDTIKTGTVVPNQLRFIAVGGAPVSTRLLDKAKALKLPIFEGYGLSECASVVAVNTPEHHRTGSVGKVLPHIQISFSEDKEIMVTGHLFDGYLNHKQKRENPIKGRRLPDSYASGDLGYLDNDGYLYITGRKKSCFITSYGRNVAPEWVEKELTVHPLIAQAVVFGEARPYNIALLWLNRATREDDNPVAGAIAEANSRLPDYARITAWLIAETPFSAANQQLTANGRPRRETIWSIYEKRIEQLYSRPNTQPNTQSNSLPCSRLKRSQNAIL